MRDEFEEHGSKYFALAPEHMRSINPVPEKGPPDAQEGPEAPSAPSQEPPSARQSSSNLDDESEYKSESQTDESRRLVWGTGGFLETNPLGVPTERELQTMGHGQPVYRVLLTRI